MVETRTRLHKPSSLSVEAVRLFADAPPPADGGGAPAPAAGGAPAAPAAPAFDAGKLAAELQAAQAKLATFEAKAREGDAATRKQLEEQGQYKALAEKHAADLAAAQAKLAEQDPLAGIGKAFVEREKARIDAVVKDMDAEWKATLDAVGDNVLARGKLIDRYLATKTPPAPGAKPPAGGAPPSGPAPAVDAIAALRSAGGSMQALRLANPAAYAQLMSSDSVATSDRTMFGFPSRKKG
jgi:hypothetical protein